MAEGKRRVRDLALGAAVVCFALSSPALAQPTKETQRQDMPAGATTSHDGMNSPGRIDDAPDRPRGDWREDDGRPRGQFGRNDNPSRGFDLRRRDRDDRSDLERRNGQDFDRGENADNRSFSRGGRDRNDWRDAGGRHNRGFDRDARDRPRSLMMGQSAMMMSHGWLMRVCGPNGDRIATFMVDRLERLTQPTEGQRAAVDTLKDATARASEIARAACPTERPITPPGRLAAAEKRFEALLQAVRTVRPAMDAFYGMLSDEQKARILIAQVRPPRWGGGHDRREIDRRGDRFGGSSGDFRSEGRNLEGNRWRNEEDSRSREHGREARGQGNGLHPMPGDDEDSDGWPDQWQGRL